MSLHGMSGLASMALAERRDSRKTIAELATALRSMRRLARYYGEASDPKLIKAMKLAKAALDRAKN